MFDLGFKPGGRLRLFGGVAFGLVLLALVLSWVVLGPGWALPPEGHRELQWSRYPDGRPFAPKVNDFGFWLHEAGDLILRISNVGVFGANWISPIAYYHEPYPSAEWPAGSGNDYLWAGGLWVGGITSEGDTLVTAAVYQGEFFPATPPLDRVRESSVGSPGGVVGRGPTLPEVVTCGGVEYPMDSCDFFLVGEGDDDGDGLYDEDFLDGYDNDGDGVIDEDYAAHSAEMLASVYYDTTDWFNDYISDPEDHHHPLNLRVEQRSYAWQQERANDFIGMDFTVISMDTSRVIYNAYVGFMLDPDCGPNVFGTHIARDDWSDYVEFDTVYTPPGSTTEECLHASMAYAWDDPGGDDGDGATGIIGVMFLGHTTDESGQSAPPQVEIHAYRNWSGAGEDPENDGYRYRYLRGNSDVSQTIDPKTPIADDWRFLVSAGPFAEFTPGDSVSFQVAFVAGERHPEMDNYPAGDDVEKKRFLGTLIDHAIEAQRTFNNCWSTLGECSEESLMGAWIMALGEAVPEEGPKYVVFDGAGGIDDIGIYNLPDSAGTYSVEPDGSFEGYLWMDDYAHFTGRLYSESTAGMTLQLTGDTLSFPLLQVMDEAACSGAWCGSFVQDSPGTTYSVQMVINEFGEIISADGFAPPVVGKFFYEPPFLAGHFRTGEDTAGCWHEIGIEGGSVGADTMSGRFGLDCAAPGGTFRLVKGPSAIRLVSFSAVHFGDHVEVEWQTGVEIDNAGFNLYRGFERDGPYAPINDRLIPAMAMAVEGASYIYTDRDVATGATYYYWLEDLDVHGVGTTRGPVAARPGSVVKPPVPAILSLAQNDPNPFNTGTAIRYGVPVACDVKLTVYNLVGQRVRTLVSEHQPAGYGVVHWDGRNENGAEVSGGVYFYELRAGDRRETRKMVLLR